MHWRCCVHPEIPSPDDDEDSSGPTLAARPLGVGR
jgi:hypothetical protein